MLFLHATQPVPMADHYYAALQASPQHADSHHRQSVGECRKAVDDECNPRRKRPKVASCTLDSSSMCSPRSSSSSSSISSQCSPSEFSVRFVNCLPPLPSDTSCACQAAAADVPMCDGMDVDMSAAVVGSCTDRAPSQRSRCWSPCSQQLCWQAVDYANRKLQFSYVDEVDLKLEQLFMTYKLQQQQSRLWNKQRYQPSEAAIAEDDDTALPVARTAACGQSAHSGSGITFANCLPPLPAAAPSACWPAYA